GRGIVQGRMPSRLSRLGSADAPDSLFLLRTGQVRGDLKNFMNRRIEQCAQIRIAEASRTSKGRRKRASIKEARLRWHRSRSFLNSGIPRKAVPKPARLN